MLIAPLKSQNERLKEQLELLKSERANWREYESLKGTSTTSFKHKLLSNDQENELKEWMNANRLISRKEVEAFYTNLHKLGVGMKYTPKFMVNMDETFTSAIDYAGGTVYVPASMLAYESA
eukprot:m51a1_g3154 hypothetical protein (121) ;mRNA; f:340192-343043